ncbi:MAG TPA: DUF4410 domain-containing protein [Verrucomicrobiae bacterium]|nr:DUF4410 domain-containing protein [Verrucomicrobiae bacterium]
MSKIRPALWSALALVAAVFALGTGAARTEEPTMSIREGVLDEIEIKALILPKDSRVVVRPFDASRADLGTAEAGDNQKRVDAAKMMQRESPDMLADALVNTLELGGAFAGAKKTADAPGAKDLVVEGKIVMINPGSRAKRMTLVAAGKGKSGIGVEGTVKNAKGDVLATFRHTRHSGIGLAGGDYVKFLSDDTKDVGHDIAVFLKRWATGGDLHADAKK